MVDTQDIWRKKSSGGFVSENPLCSAQARAANPLSFARPHASSASTVAKPQSSAPPNASTVSLRQGDTLWEVAQKKLGDGTRWHEFHKADGSRFTGQEARHLQVGTQVHLPRAKMTTETPHPVTLRSSTSRVSTQVLRPEGITRRELTLGSTPLTRSTQFSASPALFSRTSQVASQLVDGKGIKRREYFNASNHKALSAGGNKDSFDSTNNNLNQIGGVAKGVAVGRLVAARGIRQTAVAPRPADMHLPVATDANGALIHDSGVAERPAADMFRKRVRSNTRELSHPHPTRGVPKVGWGDGGTLDGGRRQVKEDATKILSDALGKGENDTLLKNILEKDGDGKWKIQGSRYHMGHVGASRHSGRREMFALEDAESNRWDGTHRERKGQILQKRAVLVKNVPFPIELETARRMERDGELPKGSVKNALPHPGYAARQSVEKETRGSIKYTRPVKVTDKAIDKIRDKQFLESELKERSPQEQKRLRDKIAAGKATDADLIDPQNKNKIQDMRNLAKNPHLLEGKPSGQILTSYTSYTESLYANAPANIRAARAADEQAPRSTRAVNQALRESRVARGVRGTHLKLIEARAAGVDRVARAVRESRVANTTRRIATAVGESTAANTTRRVATAVGESTAANTARRVATAVGESTAANTARRVATAVGESTAANTARRVATAVGESTAANTARRVATAVGESRVASVARGVSRVAAPIGIGLDAWQLKNAYQKDGFGSEFRKEAGRVAGGWGGAAVGAAGGAAIGSVVPVVGTAAGAIVGGVIGGVAGSEFGDDLEQKAEEAGKAIGEGAKKAWDAINPFG